MAEKTQENAKERVARTENYAQQVRREYAQAVDGILALKKSVPTLPAGQMYSFDGDSKKVQRAVEQTLRQLHAATLATIKTGCAAEWQQANDEVDALLATTLGKKAASNPALAAWYDRNEKAMDAFLARSNNGLNLSERIWKNTQQFRDEMEVAMTVAIGEGESASAMSRRVRQYLNDPDLMFRRFRYKDDDGNWQRKWKKRVKTADGRYKFVDYDRNDYKVGAGMYKSSYRNAMRLTRTETNMAYRRADHDRWQNLDFVRGQHIETSRTHDERGKEAKDICDQLAGDYPREFVFDGWHPQCMCICTAIMRSPEEMRAKMAATLKGETYEYKEKPITTYPKGFRKFIEDNRERIAAAEQRGTQPYFITNNASVVNGILGEDIVPVVAKGAGTSVAENATTIEGILTGMPKGAAENSLQNTTQNNQAVPINASSLSNIIKNADEGWNLEYNEVKPLEQPLTEDQIISRVGGNDSSGACASLALAYAGNKCGYDVLDFRGGKSREFFKVKRRMLDVATGVGGIVDRDYNGYTVAGRLLKQVDRGKEYIFTAGKHCAIVRRGEKHLEYLELQDPYDNGFIPLNNNELKGRFECVKSHSFHRMKLPIEDCLIDIDLLRNNKDFKKLLGYINTQKDKQRKR